VAREVDRRRERVLVEGDIEALFVGDRVDPLRVVRELLGEVFATPAAAAGGGGTRKLDRLYTSVTTFSRRSGGLVTYSGGKQVTESVI
jgi:hypothetical protein